MISIKIDSDACYWTDYNNSPNWDDCHPISELSEFDIVAPCLFSDHGLHQVIYRGYIFWVFDSLEVRNYG